MSENNHGEMKLQFKQFVEKLPARVILYILALSNMVVMFSMRSLLNFTILAMVKENNVNETLQNNSAKLCSLKEESVKPNDYGGTLEWSNDAQYYVLTSFFWTYILSQVFGALAAHRYGAKVVVGIASFTASVCCLCQTFASEIHYGVVILLQLLQGIAYGVVWPALYSMISWWIPPHEKSRYVTCFQGMAIGTAFAQITSGYIIAYCGWKYVFYLSGTLGMIWCSMWYFLAYDKPELHPRISIIELNYIKESRTKELSITKRKVPWKSLFCSIPLWAIGVASFGRMWVQATINVYGPKYLKTVLGLDVQLNGLWSSLISLATFLWGLILSYISDKLETNKVIPTVVNRKLFTGIGLAVSGLLCILTSHLNCNVNLTLIYWAFLQMFLTTAFIGTMTNIVDIAPNFSGSVTSLIQIVLLTPTILSTFVAKHFLKDESTIESWKGIFYTSSGIVFIACFLYIMFASGSAQEWDTLDIKRKSDKSTSKESEAEELQALHN